MEYQVTMQMDGEDVGVGTLYANVRRGVESSSFRYTDSYLSDPRAFPLAPDMPLSPTTLYSQGRSLFGTFEDCMPDRWGRNLLLRAEGQRARRQERAARTLFEHDFLAGVSDATRQGALRIWADGVPIARAGEGVPREVSIPALLSAADRSSQDADADVSDLIAAGSSLGGARPKASVVDERGVLHIAKFPKPDDSPLEDVCAWEKTALDLARACGIRVPATRLLRVDGRSVLLIERFDRYGDGLRIAYLSALTAIQGRDGGRYSYLDIASFLEEEGSAPDGDIRELWKRVLFSCAIGNTDDHMRNHGFIRDGLRGWRLSPLFDVNPTPGNNPKTLRSLVDFDNGAADCQLVLDACEWYRMSRSDAREAARLMAGVLGGWRKVARANGIGKASLSFFETCFESGVKRLREVR